MLLEQTRSAGQGLERSCQSDGSWIASARPSGGVELFRAWFAGKAYDTHRHDTYAVGLTDSGVQMFDYRGAGRASTAGQVVVLHPDEPHDGSIDQVERHRHAQRRHPRLLAPTRRHCHRQRHRLRQRRNVQLDDTKRRHLRPRGHRHHRRFARRRLRPGYGRGPTTAAATAWTTHAQCTRNKPGQ